MNAAITERAALPVQSVTMRAGSMVMLVPEARAA
jgi:hypothetical protein